MESSARSWLETQCRTIPGVVAGVVLRAQAGDGDGPSAANAKVIAAWPAQQPVSPELLRAARSGLKHGQLISNEAGPTGEPIRSTVAATLPLEGAPDGSTLVAAVELEVRDPAAATAASGRLRDGAAWLAALTAGEGSAAQLGAVLSLLAVCLEQERFRSTATAVATELATRLGCERVSVGMLRAGRMRIEALSHSAHFDPRSQLLRDLAAAMEEATDQDAMLLYPLPLDARPCITTAHEQLAQAHRIWEICTVPLTSGGEVVGAVTLERPQGSGFAPDTVQFCQDLAPLLAPALAMKQRFERSALERLRERVRADVARLLKPGHLRLKAAVAGGALLLLLGALAPASYRVKADATLEGRLQRAIVARVEGFVAEANARAGDVVKQGQTLALLDQRDLALEHRQSAARREQLRVEYFEALAAHDRTLANIASARIAQTEAGIALLEEQLARTRLMAPFDGVVVKGDLSQLLGSPVSRGDVLFEVAPLDGYRVILKVDEREIRDVVEGTRGQLTLSAMPGEPLPFTVERVTPVAKAEDGRNHFRAEARLDHPPTLLRPGMEGVARIDAGRRSLVWIWTHDLVDWLRLWLWSWWP